MARRGKLDDRDARHDGAYRRAKASGFAARAVFKLEEIDKRFRLLAQGRRVLDLGCWPGSWMQYAGERVGGDGLVVGYDLRPCTIALPSWVHPRQGDVTTLDTAALVEEFGRFDVVISDMAPHTTGDRTSDQFHSEELCRVALQIATQVLRAGGHFAAKVFQGGGFPALLKETREAFAESKSVHAQATRAGSREQYIVGRGLRRIAIGSAASP
ncbi:MAG: RlmE family RNA methyltransferase [Deltaproteobacteria bacterium]|nr:RlmE family RNA methyltransferase [Deltaproteobacteria bacterium]MBK8236632.1 RlmE family RNA methyltransferase [Deltaproteobacteria bacterium]MBK8717741.1 RlmE family RNA methyltransferase [Deltaproteobacteria bacterium]MBP7288791.1 RlmE family RNA methyltransferase [Nannocystaceae bacterium]